MNEADIKEAFLAAMRASGVHMDCASNRGGHPIADGVLHRADSTDKGGQKKRHVWYVLHVDEPPSGTFGHFKLGIQDNWTGGRSIKEMTPAERAAIKQRLDDARRQREEYAARMAVAAADVAARMMTKENSVPVKEHPYLAEKGLPAFPGARVLMRDVCYVIDPERGQETARKGTLIVPMYHTTEGNAKLVGVQMIWGDGKKLFVRGTPKQGAFHSVGKHRAPDAPIYLAEGYATAARIHQDTNDRAIACFDAGNLTPASLALKKKYPAARFIVMADNDRFTTQPLNNPGVHYAREAAEAIGAPIVIPQFEQGEDKATDFDDLYQIHGDGCIRAAIDALLNPSVKELPPPPDDMPFDGQFDAVAEDFSDDGVAPRPLGQDEGTYYYWVPGRGQVATIPGSGHTKSALLGIAPLSWWEMNYPAKSGCDWDAAANAMLRLCEREGVFDPSVKVGRGVIIDRERIVAHLGNRLLVDGKPHGLSLPGARWIYTKRPELCLGKAEPLDTATTREFEALLTRPSWTEPDMGRILAGWLTIAPICGALNWRSHIWLTAERGAGKSYIMEQIAASVLKGFAIEVQGNTTEPGIRRALRGDILPVLFDECEAKTEADKHRIGGVLALARQASSANGAPIIKAGGGQASAAFHVRSSFLFASIDKNGTQPADESRIITLSLRGTSPFDDDDDKRARAEHFAKLKADAERIITPAFGRGLFLRTLALVPTILQNAETFAAAIAKKTGSRRLGDTLAGPLAGWMSLHTTAVITPEVAMQRLDQWRWLGGAIARGKTDADHDAALTHLLQASLRLDGSKMRTVDELVATVLDGGQNSELPVETCSAVLNRHGLRVMTPEEQGGGAVLVVANSHAELERIFRAQPFNLGTLRQHPAARSWPQPVRFSGHGKVRALAIDLMAAGVVD
ncbi:toprim domain-containing protein [Rhodomicrobium lacus]|uniref:toprim domain-containing protein n=1 Tax=Rhodomicrobium lacus TaxID=2498452 RepID=UPI000F8F7525|nr:toprim domain-containing protein [Rhodomicrobium lacus]